MPRIFLQYVPHPTPSSPSSGIWRVTNRTKRHSGTAPPYTACAGPARRAAYLQAYSTCCLLGEYVPYPVEAYPENNQRHLSAESGLYGRVITEGLCDIRPTGLKRFTCNPRLPAVWDQMALRSSLAFGQDFDIAVTRPAPNQRLVTVICNGKEILAKTTACDNRLTVELA